MSEENRELSNSSNENLRNCERVMKRISRSVNSTVLKIKFTLKRHLLVKMSIGFTIIFAT